MGSLYLAYLVATGLLVISPGATTAVVVRNTLGGGHRAGVLAALGAGLANTLHAMLADLGLWALVGRWPLALDGLRSAGAAYLAWLGLRSLARAWGFGSARDASVHPAPPPGDRRLSSFREGLTVNILNPAIISFYLAVVPTFIPPTPPRYYFGVLAATHIVLALVCHIGWATAFHALRPIFARPGFRASVELGTAGSMLWLAARALVPPLD